MAGSLLLGQMELSDDAINTMIACFAECPTQWPNYSLNTYMALLPVLGSETPLFPIGRKVTTWSYSANG